MQINIILCFYVFYALRFDSLKPHFSHVSKKSISNKNDITDKVGLRIKKLRNNLAISQTELGFRADIPQSSVLRIEKGKINTTIVTLDKIAKALNVSLKDLFDFEKDTLTS